jgi:hypothetical protein
LPIGRPLIEPPGIFAAGFFAIAANKAFSSKLKANAAPVDTAADFFKKLRRFRFSDIAFLSFSYLNHRVMPNLDFAEDFVQINHLEHEYYYIKISSFVQPVTAEVQGLCDAA